MSKSTKKSMPFKIDFWCDFDGFWKENGGKLALKWHLKSILTWNSVRPKKHYNSCIILKTLGVWGYQHRSIIYEKQSKIEVNMGRPPGLHFSGFWWIWGPNLGPSWEGKSSQDRTRQDKTGQDRTRQVWILVDLGSQVGREKGAKTGQEE